MVYKFIRTPINITQMREILRSEEQKGWSLAAVMRSKISEHNSVLLVRTSEMEEQYDDSDNGC